MGIKWNSFSIKGIDVSAFNGNINWQKVMDASTNFCGIRAGYGKTTDSKFLVNWAGAKGKTARFIYWYMDYYSNWYNNQSSVYGITDAEWGKRQAQYCFNLLKNDYNNTPVMLDIESGGSSYSPPITSTTATPHAQGIAKAFLEEMDRLNHLVNGIYCSFGLLSWFPIWFRNRPLWVAWYTDYQTPETIKTLVKNKGWTGEVLAWQYASDGDIDDNGTPDGVTIFGTQLKQMDLNGWTATTEDFNKFFSGSIIVSPPVPEPIPDIGTLYYPLPEGIRISQTFGVNPQWYPTTKGHNGVDWACGVGTPIYAMQDGKVIRADALQGKTGYGRHVRIQHVEGVSIYGHLSKLLVSVGETVKAGQLVGLSGGAITDSACGNSTGAHLHGEFRLDGVENPVPGGYVYNAIDILPLIQSYPDDPNIVPLYSVRVISGALNVRTSPVINSSNIIKTVPYWTLANVYEEKDGFGKISKVHNEWMSISPKYVSKEGGGNTLWIVTSSIGLKIRELPTTSSPQIGSLSYNQKFYVSEIVSGNWGKLATTEGYVCLDYAVQI